MWRSFFLNQWRSHSRVYKDVTSCSLIIYQTTQFPIPVFHDLLGQFRHLNLNIKTDIWRKKWSLLICQEIFSILWNPKVYYHVHKSAPPFSVLGQMNPVHILLSYFFNISSMIRFSKCPLPTSSFYQNCACISFPCMLHALLNSSSIIWSS
jgi:hypothetical protein